MVELELQKYHDRLEGASPMVLYGKITDVVGLTIEATGPPMRIGDLCYVQNSETMKDLPVEVVGFRGERILLMPLGHTRGIAPGSLLRTTSGPLRVRIGPDILGRVLNGLGQPMDGGPPLAEGEVIELMAAAPRPFERERILEPIATGIRAIDACITAGKGQRMGIMSGSGIGKSKLIGMVARNTNADVNIIALIGERGREVRDFIEVDLGSEGLERSVVVAATSDEPALVRIKGAYLATAIAEWYRDRGAHVMLMMDSVTRFAMAQREVGLAIGEPPTTRGYPPSVYSALPRLLERAGACATGSITGFYSVLVEGDDLNEPIADAVRSILDGHVVLSRDLFSRGHYPAIDVLESISRAMLDVTSDGHRDLAQRIRTVLATYRDAEDLVNIGAYVKGTNPEIDTALRLMPKIRTFLQQDLFEVAPFDRIESAMEKALA